MNNILKHPGESSKLKSNSDLPATSFITLPDEWWYTQNSYNLKPEKQKLNLIKIDSVKQVRKIPKANHWQLSQGDYLIKEKYRCVSETIERKKKFVKYSMYPAMFICAWFVWYVLRFII